VAQHSIAAYAGSGMGSVGRAGGLYLIWLCMICACQSAASPTLAERCERAADARQADTADLCLPAYELTRDPALGARAARSLQDRAGARPIIEWIASAIGDGAAGADAWLAVGATRIDSDDLPGALAAFERAVAMRGPRDIRGQLLDAGWLIYFHLIQSDYQAAAAQAVIAHGLVRLVESREDRAAAYINIATLLMRIGNLSATEEILEEARSVIPVTSRHYAEMRQLDAAVERGYDHREMETLALDEAHALAIRDGDRALERNTRFNLIEAAIRNGALRDAEAWLSLPLPPDASASDRAAVAYHRALLAFTRGDAAAAAELVERVLPEAPDSWVESLEGVHGRALAHGGRRAPAERALLRSVEAIERRREAIDSDTFKSWLLAAQRAPFEDLFLLYVDEDRLRDALAIVQRATARSILDGLLVAAHDDSSRVRDLAAAGAWGESMRKLAHALRSSRAAARPQMAALLDRLRGNHVLTYFRARGDLWAIAVTGDGSLRARKIGGIAELAARVAAWQEHRDDPEIADQLGTALMPDALMPPDDVPVYIAADDAIGDVAFAALRRHGELVVEHHPVAYAPSAAVLSATRRSSSPIRPMVLGDPTGDLPQARQEATEVARRLQVTPRLGSEATMSAVLDAGGATLIHVAAHTASTSAGAALRLSDGLLDAGAVIDHGVTAGAIVLMTCLSDAITSRDELAPLASAFIAAGAHTVVASRWVVSDGVARDFAEMFYQANGIVDPVRAVAKAQRQLMRKRVPVNDWATFVVVGGLP
jgi:tetratricopeptide (TPR) repeat protein